jgi:hypothetical protein
VVLLDCVIAGLEATLGRHVVRVQQAKFQATLRPGEVAATVCEFSGDIATFRVAVHRSGQEVSLAAGRLSLQRDKN